MRVPFLTACISMRRNKWRSLSLIIVGLTTCLIYISYKSSPSCQEMNSICDQNGQPDMKTAQSTNAMRSQQMVSNSKQERQTNMKTNPSTNRVKPEHSKLEQECRFINISSVNSSILEKSSAIKQINPKILQLVKNIQNCKWKKQDEEYQKFRSQLTKCCDAFSHSAMTQENTPVGSNIPFDGQPGKKTKATERILKMLPKDSPFKGSAPYKRCAVVGNSGNLSNSSCGAQIDQADFVFRCNLPDISEKHKADVGYKTNLVTANPSIFKERYANLDDSRKPFADVMTAYGDSLLLMSPFSFMSNEVPCFRAFFTLKDFESKSKPIFLSPIYLTKLLNFWRANGVEEQRLSTGLLLMSMALELCSEVHLYGFWPFQSDTEGRNVPYHYYDDVGVGPGAHFTVLEFLQHLKLHTHGVIRIHLGDCVQHNE